MSPVSRLLCLLCAAASFGGCAGVPRSGGAGTEKEVAAEGWAALQAGDESGTRRRALADAQRKAVEQVSGVALSAWTRVEDAVSVRQKMLSEVRGHVIRQRVLDERVEDGFLKLRIAATVRTDGAPAADWSPPPDVAVALTVAGSGPRAEEVGAMALAAVRRELLARGFEVVAAGSAQRHLDLRVAARATPVFDRRLGPLESARARVSLSAWDGGSGIWDAVQEATALDVTPPAASDQAADAAGAAVGRRAAQELAQLLWRRY
ncbi:MAG: hypothetical protein WC881_03035 [Elusimicrobiota bacterium]|jgi:hypothetical protein